MHWNFDCGRQGRELLSGSRSARVGGNEHRAPTVFRQSVSKFCSRGRLTGSLQPQQEDGRWPFAQIKFATRATQRLRQRTVQDPQHAFACTEATNNLACTGPFTNTLQQLRDDRHRHICLDEGAPNVGKASLEVGGANSPTPRQAAE
jgi:hypothetical protein